MDKRLSAPLALLAFLAGLLMAESSPAAGDGGLASLSRSIYSERDRKPNSIIFWPVAVDGRQLTYRLLNEVVETPPGVRKIAARGSFGMGALGETMTAIVEFDADLQPGRSYAINGEIRDDTLAAWLVDAKSGERLPHEGLAEWGPAPRNVTVPILLPAR